MNMNEKNKKDQKLCGLRLYLIICAIFTDTHVAYAFGPHRTGLDAEQRL